MAEGHLYNVCWSSNLVSGYNLIGSNFVEGLFVDTNANLEVKGFYKIMEERDSEL